MLTTEQFEAWCHRLHLSETTKTRIERIRTSEPARKVKSSASNVSGSYCSKKMGVTMQFESHKVELPLVVTCMEWDAEVLEYYDQPESIKLNYKSQAGKAMGVIYTPDFFVIRSDGAGYEECKTEQELEKLSAKNKERYIKDENGNWRCPPGEKFAEQYGLYFRVRSSKEINWICYRNLEYLQDYFSSPYEVSAETKSMLLALVHAHEGITFQELLDSPGAFSADDINTMLASGELYFNRNKDCFDEPGNVALYSSKNSAELRQGTESTLCTYQTSPIEITVGRLLNWDGVIHEIVNVGEHTVSLKSEKEELLTLDYTQFQQLIGTNQLRSYRSSADSTLAKQAQQIIMNASSQDLDMANNKADIVKQHLCGDKEKITTPERTVRDWVRKYKLAEQMWGQGYIGLIPKNSKKGNHTLRFSETVVALINTTIQEHHVNGIATSKKYAYGFLQKGCQEQVVTVPSYPTFCSYIDKFSPIHNRTLLREGTRAAYDYQPFYWELERTTPKHGSRPFELAHIDHTEFDIQLKLPEGRPWATIMTDANTRRLLAVYITMDPPSYRSNMMVVRECVKRFNRLPQTIIVDGGKDFSSIYFEQLLARFEINKKVRPKAQGHFGSVCERLFGTSSTQLIHNLVGNTQLTKQVRKLTKKFDPKNLAIWDLESFNELFKLWAYEFYDADDHPALGVSPHDFFMQGIELTGARKQRLIPYDDSFKFATLPTTRKGTAKIFPGRGFKLKSIYYWSDEFRIPEHEGKSVPIRYDPWNIGIAYAFIQGDWVECISQYYAILQGRTERELLLATEEIRKNKANSQKKYIVSAAQLAEFFQKNVRSKEQELKEQYKTGKDVPELQVLPGKGKCIEPNRQKLESDKNSTLPSVSQRTVPRQIYEEY